MVFAAAYAAYLRYYDADDVRAGHVAGLLRADASAQLAAVAIEDVPCTARR